MTAKTKEKRVAYHGFSVDELGAEKTFCGYDAFNVDCRNGRLTTATGCRLVVDAFNNTITVPENSIRRFFQGVVKTETGDLEKVYFSVWNAGALSMFQSGKGWIVLGEIAPFDCLSVRVENGEVWNVLLTDLGVYVVKQFGVLEQKESMACLAGCFLGERMFYGCKNGEIVYSKPSDPTMVMDSIEDGGRLYLPADSGEIVAMKGVGETVYAFCERAVYAVKTQAKANEFVVRRIAYDGGRIVKNGVAVLGDVVLILAEDGAYRMQNDVIKKAFERLHFDRIEVARGCEYGCFEGKATFSYYVYKRTGYARKSVTLYADGKSGYFTDVYTALSGGENGAFFLKGNTLSAFGGPYEPFSTAPSFCARQTDLGVFGRKTLKKMRVYGTGEATLVVTCEQGQREYRLQFRKGVAEARLVESGFSFAFAFRPKLDSVLDGADVEFLCVEE